MGRKRSRSLKRRRRRGREKNKSEAESCFPDVILPEEIVVEILSRLSLGSLIPFTCASKQWHSLISCICVTKTEPPTVLLVSESRAYSFSPHSINRHNHAYVKSVFVPWDMKEEIERFRILGSCTGLLLLCMDTDLFLWNPLTRFFKKVLAYFRLGDWCYYVRSAGLCYDSTSDEYKAVLALAHETPDYGGEFVVIGGFKSKSWTVIEFPYMVRSVNSGPIVKGNLHWFASKNDLGNPFLPCHQIIYFDAHMDKFVEVPMPEPRGEDGDNICGLGVLDGYFCMSRSESPGDSESNIELLMMKEYGVKNSWTIMFAVSDGFSVPDLPLVPLGYTMNGRVLIKVFVRKCSDYHIRAFDLNTNSHKRISIPKLKDRYLDVIAYEESLITPTDYGWEEEELKGEATYVEYGSHLRRSDLTCRKRKKGRNGYWSWEYESSNKEN